MNKEPQAEFLLRIPQALYDRLRDVAKVNQRSVNRQIIYYVQRELATRDAIVRNAAEPQER